MGRLGRGVAELLLVLLTAGLTACGGASERETSVGGAPAGEITVFAAASLTEAFQEIAAAFSRGVIGSIVAPRET